MNDIFFIELWTIVIETTQYKIMGSKETPFYWTFYCQFLVSRLILPPEFMRSQCQGNVDFQHLTINNLKGFNFSQIQFQ